MDALWNGLSLLLYALLLFASDALAQNWAPCTWPEDTTLPSAVNINHMKKDITENEKAKVKINIGNENEPFTIDNTVANHVVSKRVVKNNFYENVKNNEDHVKVDTNIIKVTENQIGHTAYANAGNEMYKNPCVSQNDNSHVKYVNPYANTYVKPYVKMLPNLIYFKPLKSVSSIWRYWYNGIYNTATSYDNNGVSNMKGYYTYKWLLPTNQNVNNANIPNYTAIDIPYYYVNQNDNNEPVPSDTANFDKDINYNLRPAIISAIGFTNNRNAAIRNVEDFKPSYNIKTRPIIYGQENQEAIVNYKPKANSKNSVIPIEVNTKYEAYTPEENNIVKITYILSPKHEPEETNYSKIASEQSKYASKMNLSTASAYFEPTVPNPGVQIYTTNRDFHPQNLRHLSDLNSPDLTYSSTTKSPITFNVKPIPTFEGGFGVYASNKETYLNPKSISSTNEPQMDLSNKITFNVKHLSGNLYDTEEYLGKEETRFLDPGVKSNTNEPKMDLSNEVTYNVKLSSANQYGAKDINNKLNTYLKPGAILYTNKPKMDLSIEDNFKVESMPTSEYGTVVNSNNEQAKYFNVDTVLMRNEHQMDSNYKVNYVGKPTLLPTYKIPQIYKYDRTAINNETLKSSLLSQVKINTIQSMTTNEKENVNLNNDLVTYNVNNECGTCQKPYFIEMKPIVCNQKVQTYDYEPETQNLQLLHNKPTLTNYNPLPPIKGNTESRSIIPATCKEIEGKYFLKPTHNLPTTQRVVTPIELVKNNELPINRNVESQPSTNDASLIPGTTSTYFVPTISNPCRTGTSKMNPGPTAVYFEPKTRNLYPQKSRLISKIYSQNLDLTTSSVNFVSLSSLNVFQMHPNNKITFNNKPLTDDTEVYSNDEATKYPNPNTIFITDKPQTYPGNEVINNVKDEPESECADNITENIRRDTKLSPNNFEIGSKNGVNFNFQHIPESEKLPEVYSYNKATQDTIFKTHEPLMAPSKEATYNIKPMHGILCATDSYPKNGVTKYLEPKISLNCNDNYKVKHISEIEYSTEDCPNNGNTGYPDQMDPSNELTDNVKPIPGSEYSPEVFSTNKAHVLFYPGAILSTNKPQGLSNQIIYNDKHKPGQQRGIKDYSNNKIPERLYPSAISRNEMKYNVKPIAEKQYGIEVYPHNKPSTYREPSIQISANTPPIIPSNEDISIVKPALFVNYLKPQTFEYKQSPSASSNLYDARLNPTDESATNLLKAEIIPSYYEKVDSDKPAISQILKYVPNSKNVLDEPNLKDDLRPFKAIEPDKDNSILNRGVGVIVPIQNAFIPSYLKPDTIIYNKNIVPNYGPVSFIQPIYETNKKEELKPLHEPEKTMSDGLENFTYHPFYSQISNISPHEYPTQAYLPDSNLSMENFNTNTIIKEAPIKYDFKSNHLRTKIPDANSNHVVPVIYTAKTNQVEFYNNKYKPNEMKLVDQAILYPNSTPRNDGNPIQIDSLNIRKIANYSVPLDKKTKSTNIPMKNNVGPISDSYGLNVKEPGANYNLDTFDSAAFVNRIDYNKKYLPTGAVQLVPIEDEPFINAPTNMIQDNLNNPFITIKHHKTSELKPELCTKNHYSPESSKVTQNTALKERSDNIYPMEDNQNPDVRDDTCKEKGYNEEPLLSTRQNDNFQLNEVCSPINNYNSFTNTNPKFYEYDKDNTLQNKVQGKMPYTIENPDKFGTKMYNKNLIKNYQIINQMGDEIKSNEPGNDSDLNGNGEILEDMTPTSYKLIEMENITSTQYEIYTQPEYMPYNYILQTPTNYNNLHATVPSNLIHTKTLDYEAQPVTTFEVTSINNHYNNNGDDKRFNKKTANNPMPKANENFNTFLKTINIVNPCGVDEKTSPQNYEDIKLMKLNNDGNEKLTDGTAAYVSPVCHYVGSPSVNTELPSLNDNESQTEPNHYCTNTKLKDSTGILNSYNPRSYLWKYPTTAECSLNAAVSNNLGTVTYPIVNNNQPGKDTFNYKVDDPFVEKDREKPLLDKDKTQYFTPSQMTHINNIPIINDIKIPSVPSPQYTQEKVPQNIAPIDMFKGTIILNTGPIIINNAETFQSTSMLQEFKKIRHIDPVENYEAGLGKFSHELYDNKEQTATENNSVNDPKLILTNKDNTPTDITYFLSNGRNNLDTSPQETRTAVNDNNFHISYDTSFEVKNDFNNNSKNKAFNDCYKTFRPEYLSVLPIAYTRPEIKAYNQYNIPLEVKLNDESNTNQRKKTDSNVFLNDLQLNAPNILPSMNVKYCPSTPNKAFTGQDNKLLPKETRNKNNNGAYPYDTLRYYQNYETTSPGTYDYIPQRIRDGQNNIRSVNDTTAKILKGSLCTQEYNKNPGNPVNVDANIKYNDKDFDTPNLIQETAEHLKSCNTIIVPQSINNEPNFLRSITKNYQIKNPYVIEQTNLKETTIEPNLQDLSNQKLNTNALIGEKYRLYPNNDNIPVSSNNQNKPLNNNRLAVKIPTTLETIGLYRPVNKYDVTPKTLIKMPEIMEGESNLLPNKVNDEALNYITYKSPMISKLMNNDNSGYKTEELKKITSNGLPKSIDNFIAPTMNIESMPVFKNIADNIKSLEMPMITEALLEYQEMPQYQNHYQNKPVNPEFFVVPVKYNAGDVTGGNILNMPNKKDYANQGPYIYTNNIAKPTTVCNKTVENKNKNNGNNLRVHSDTNAIRVLVNSNGYSYKDPNKYKDTFRAWAGTNQLSNSLKGDDILYPNTNGFPRNSYPLYSSLNLQPNPQPYTNNIQDSPLVKHTGKVSTLTSSFDSSKFNSIPFSIKPSSFGTIQSSKPSKSSVVSSSLNIPNPWYGCVSPGQIGLGQTLPSTSLPVALEKTFNPNQYVSPSTERSNSLQNCSLTTNEKPLSISTATESLKNNLVNYLNRNEIKNSLYYNPTSITIPLGNLGIAKYYPQVNEKYFTVKTENDDINLKAWYSKLKVVKAKITFETNETDVLNFLPIVKNKAKYNPNEIRNIAKDAVSNVYGEPLVVNGVFSQEYPYAIVSNVNNSFNNGRYILLWPTFCDCGCEKAGCQCFWDKMSNKYLNTYSL